MFSGSAALRGTTKRVDTLVVFVGDRAVYVGRAENLKPHAILGEQELGKTGFEFELPPSLLPAPESGKRVRVFALRGPLRRSSATTRRFRGVNRGARGTAGSR